MYLFLKKNSFILILFLFSTLNIFAANNDDDYKIIERHIIFCQNDNEEITKNISDFIKSKIYINNKKINTKIINVYSKGLLYKYRNAILEKANTEKQRKEKLTYINKNKVKKKFYSFFIQTTQQNNKTESIYPSIKINAENFKHLKKEIIKELKKNNYNILNNKKNADLILTIEINKIIDYTLID
ncbi:MAG: hypothetical protein SVN78_00430 [Deferribacterota bacterium]|nr:hypothetical protein [Deferribacterota bacterium]